jgi:hypothetical protein
LAELRSVVELPVEGAASLKLFLRASWRAMNVSTSFLEKSLVPSRPRVTTGGNSGCLRVYAMPYAGQTGV